ncbi:MULTISPECIES: hypothetical protein [unclassified Okeania]|uniref:hypothetical protein n=1 Tax=unclassified Okeania TaxID=2634635 RepID=UPI00257B880F|nr:MULTISPECIES: hypothetical protein [unclassified Okeania]
MHITHAERDYIEYSHNADQNLAHLDLNVPKNDAAKDCFLFAFVVTEKFID